MSSQDRIPQTLTTMEAAFTLHEAKELQEEFWRHQERMGPIAAASPGFVAVIGGPIHRSLWLYFSGKWATPQLMDKWQSDAKHEPAQEAAHSRWFASVYLRKWRLPADNEALTGPLLCELAIARRDPLETAAIDRILDEIVGPSLHRHKPLKFETLTGEFEKQPYQFVGPVQEFPVLAPVRYLLITHWATEVALQGWLNSDVIKQLSAYGEISSTISVPIKHDAGERKYLRPDGLQRCSLAEAAVEQSDFGGRHRDDTKDAVGQRTIEVRDKDSVAALPSGTTGGTSIPSMTSRFTPRAAEVNARSAR